MNFKIHSDHEKIQKSTLTTVYIHICVYMNIYNTYIYHSAASLALASAYERKASQLFRYVWLQQTLYLAATRSIDCCNRLHICLCLRAEGLAAFPLCVVAVDSIYGGNTLYRWLQQTPYIPLPTSERLVMYGLTDSIQGCNRLLKWLQHAL